MRFDIRQQSQKINESEPLATAASHAPAIFFHPPCGQNKKLISFLWKQSCSARVSRGWVPAHHRRSHACTTGSVHMKGGSGWQREGRLQPHTHTGSCSENEESACKGAHCQSHGAANPPGTGRCGKRGTLNRQRCQASGGAQLPSPGRCAPGRKNLFQLVLPGSTPACTHAQLPAGSAPNPPWHCYVHNKADLCTWESNVLEREVGSACPGQGFNRRTFPARPGCRGHHTSGEEERLPSTGHTLALHNSKAMCQAGGGKRVPRGGEM